MSNLIGINSASVTKEKWFHRLPWHSIIVFLFIFVIRLPFAFPWVLDADESTFILLGRDVLQGNWPLVSAWDNKFPPFIVLQAIALFLAGETIVGVRIIATLILLLLVYLVRIVAGNLGLDKTTAWLAGLLTALIISENPSGAHLGTELVGLPFLFGGIAVVTRPSFGAREAFSVGVLFALAVFMRPNLVFTVLGICGVIFFYKFRSVETKLWRLVAIPAGGLAVITIVFLPYLLIGRADDLWQENVVLSLAYNDNFISTESTVAIVKRVIRENTLLVLLLMVGGFGFLTR